MTANDLRRGGMPPMRCTPGKGMTAAGIGLCCLIGSAAEAQLLAFPGAEGAGRYSTGGRGGDIYYVQNLNDSGPGSLRYGIQTASGPRTILFNVAGTIRLQSNLDINKSNITIAGQSAPGGGITIADRQTRVVNSGDVQTSNVILQYLRFRVGDTYTRQTDSTYEPDALWIAGSNNVMVDHVSASWGVDEQLSVSHGSTNVTVQWSIVGGALHNAGHHKGNHGYGSIIHGGETSILHNLYVNNRSRNPAVGGPGGGHLSVVNNVISNPGGRFSYSGGTDDYSMNFVGNYGIAGPNTSITNELFHGDSTTARIYYAGNYLDQNKNGILDGTPAPPNTLTGTYAALPSPTPAAPVNQTDAQQAYVQVLSRAGANRYRDVVDAQLVRGVVNQTGSHIDSQTEIGGWPMLPTAAAPVDSNMDGVPDYFAVSNGFSPSTNIRNALAPSGYTWLESYLHSLTPRSAPPTTTTRATLIAAADAQVSENGGTSASSSGNGSSTVLGARWNGDGGNADRNEFILLKFNLSDVQPGSITDARLELTAAADLGGAGHKLRIYGLEHNAAGWDWNEGTVQFNNAPGLVFDSNSQTRGLNAASLLTLGTIDAGGLTAGASVGFDNPNLAVFLNLAAYMEGMAQDGWATLLIERIDSNNVVTRFSSLEAGRNLAPRLIVDATIVPEPSTAIALLGMAAMIQRRRRNEGKPAA